jgi:hypothetical protein
MTTSAAKRPTSCTARTQQRHPRAYGLYGCSVVLCGGCGERLGAVALDASWLDDDLAQLEATHRQHAQVEDRVKTLKATGASNLPFSSFAANEAWLELALIAHDITVWTQQLTLDGEHAICEPKRLRYRILHVAAQLTRRAAVSPSCTVFSWWRRQAA